jgi:hypothetical protein
LFDESDSDEGTLENKPNNSTDISSLRQSSRALPLLYTLHFHEISPFCLPSTVL